MLFYFYFYCDVLEQTVLVLEVDTSIFSGIGPRQSELCLLTYSTCFTYRSDRFPKRIKKVVAINGCLERDLQHFNILI